MVPVAARGGRGKALNQRGEVAAARRDELGCCWDERRKAAAVMLLGWSRVWVVFGKFEGAFLGPKHVLTETRQIIPNECCILLRITVNVVIYIVINHTSVLASRGTRCGRRGRLDAALAVAAAAAGLPAAVQLPALLMLPIIFFY